MKPLSVEEVDRDLKSIDSKIDALQVRRAKLMAYRVALEELYTGNGVSAPKKQAPVPEQRPSPTTRRAKPRRLPKSEMKKALSMAYEILSEHASLGGARLVARMREIGWKGFGDDKTDQDMICKLMRRHPDKFSNPERGVYVAVRPTDSDQQSSD